MTKTVEINGKEYPVKFGYSALSKFCDIAGLALNELDKLGSEMTLSQAIALVWCGLKDGARYDKMKFNLAVEDVADLLDDDADALNKVLEVFSDSFGDNTETKGN